MRKPLTKMIAVLAWAVAPAGWAADHGHGTQMPSAGQALAETMTAGVIRKVDKSAGKVTIRHEEIKNLGMPPMTMVFRVKDAAWLDQLKPDDRILFVADKVNGAFTLIRYEPAN